MVDLPELPLGGSKSGLICPACLGGRSGERSFSVSRSERGEVWYLCHRASCGYRGRYAPNGVDYAPITLNTRHITPFIPRPYPYRVVPPHTDHPLWSRVGLWGIAAPGASNAALEGNMGPIAAKIGVGVREDSPLEIVWEVRDLDLEPMGSVSREYPSKRIRTWRERPGPWMGLFRLDPEARSLWIVEDPVSASRIALAGQSALCLFGTHLSREGREALGVYLRHRPELRVCVALDPDAAGIGAEMARELTFRFGRDTLFVPLKQDVKDLDGSSFREVLQI